MIARILSAAAIVLALGNLGSAAEAEKPFTELAYEDSGGFAGTGTGKWLRITAEGAIKTQVGRSADPLEGKLSEEELKRLTAAIEAVNWGKVMATYPSQGADFFVDTLALKRGEKTITTSFDEASLGVPAELKALFTLLDELYAAHKTAKE
mgnify:CR=1 FL=1